MVPSLTPLANRNPVVGSGREQVLAGVLGSLELGAADPELLGAWELCVAGAWLGSGKFGTSWERMQWEKASSREVGDCDFVDPPAFT
jgi:hypothetical protein